MGWHWGVLASSGGGGGAGAYELISTTVLATTTASISFSSIPSTYKHLELRYTARNAFASTGADQIYMRMNGSFANVYSWHELEGNGSSVVSVNSSTQPQIVIGNNGGVPRNSNTSGIFSAGICQILDYSSTTKFKTVRTLAGLHAGTSTKSVYLDSGLYQQTTAITSLTILESQSAGFVAGSRFSLYGVKG